MIYSPHFMAKNLDAGSRGPSRTAAVALSALLAACADSPTANAEAPQDAEVVRISVTSTNVQAQIDQCLADAIVEAKEDFGMSDEEIRAELDFLKEDCGIKVSQEIQIAELESSITQSQARIDAANAKLAEATDEFIRNADARDGRSQ